MSIQTNREKDKDECETIPEARLTPVIVVPKDGMSASQLCQVHGEVGSEDIGVRLHEIKQLAKFQKPPLLGVFLIFLPLPCDI